MSDVYHPGIEHPVYQDFYLQSQPGLKGSKCSQTTSCTALTPGCSQQVFRLIILSLMTRILAGMLTSESALFVGDDLTNQLFVDCKR